MQERIKPILEEGAVWVRDFPWWATNSMGWWVVLFFDLRVWTASSSAFFYKSLGNKPNVSGFSFPLSLLLVPHPHSPENESLSSRSWDEVCEAQEILYSCLRLSLNTWFFSQEAEEKHPALSFSSWASNRPKQEEGMKTKILDPPPYTFKTRVHIFLHNWLQTSVTEKTHVIHRQTQKKVMVRGKNEREDSERRWEERSQSWVSNISPEAEIKWETNSDWSLLKIRNSSLSLITTFSQ